MFRPASGSLLRKSLPAIRPVRTQRLLSTAPPAQKSRSWKSSAVRWGLAVGAVYYYNTSDAFAEQPSFPIADTPDEDTTLPTVDSILHSKRNKPTSSSQSSTESLSPPTLSSAPILATTAAIPDYASPNDPPRTPEEYEEEAGQQGAFNEETGEINWDCPCLGGMAHGPCGEQFRAAFSCFVYSKEEPKGMDCIDKFKGMQDCFRDHPDVYGAELDDDDQDIQEEDAATPSEAPSEPSQPTQPSPSPAPESGAGQTPTAALAKSTSSKPASSSAPPPSYASADTPSPSEEKGRSDRAKAATRQVKEEHEPQSESDELMPKAMFDATASNEGK
ncbi:MAG: hypothetical protein LQ347_002850 [Umbilicaria vellea]|nr:MAG: hypothetical protein LQ347_002850 [Umbilicaria vellea]